MIVGMIRRVGPVHHGIAAFTVLGVAALGAVGVVGAGDGGVFRAEHFDAKQVTVTPAGADHPDGVRVREVVDIDVGNTERRGYQRIIPNDFGQPTDVVAESPDANADVNVVQIGSDTRIRLGDPDITFTGQRRYLLEYTLPDAQLDTGRLALDVIGTDETLRTDAFTVVLAGFVGLDTPSCDVGRFGAFGGCEFTSGGDGSWVTTIEPLEPGQGITVGGAFDDLDPGASRPPVPDLPDRVGAGFRPLGIAMLVVGAGVAWAVYRAIRRRGSNVVFGAGGAADAAHGELPLPNPGLPVHDVVTHRVADDELADLATIEFVPPRGLEPWQGAALLRERIDDDTVRSWFSEMIARGTITTSGEGSDMTLHAGPTDATLSNRDRNLLAELFADGPTVSLGKYDEEFADLWKRIRREQEQLVNGAGWWERPIGTSSKVRWASFVVVPIILVIALHDAAVPLLGALGALVRDWFAALALGVLVVVGVAFVVYRSMLASRTATGSALTLRTESFRRFLEASEGRHVDWAWEQGILREYSAWAVALGAATAWSSAIRASAVPDRDVHLAGPLVMHTNVAAFSSTTVPPSSSGSGGGGFSGGVGGGGGGGSSGSW